MLHSLRWRNRTSNMQPPAQHSFEKAAPSPSIRIQQFKFLSQMKVFIEDTKDLRRHSVDVDVGASVAHLKLSSQTCRWCPPASSRTNNRDFRRHFIAAWDRKKAEAVRAMSFYSTSHPICLYREGRQGLPENLKPRHGEIDALARVAVLMSFPEVQPMWQEIANESRNRSALDHPEERLVEKNEAIEMVLLKNYFNNAAFTAPCQVSLAPYTTSVVIDPSKPPKSPKTLAWFREQKRYLKNAMGHVLVHCVKKTGDGESGADADTRFWKYCQYDRWKVRPVFLESEIREKLRAARERRQLN